jgi:hypothetical protein
MIAPNALIRLKLIICLSPQRLAIRNDTRPQTRVCSYSPAIRAQRCAPKLQLTQPLSARPWPPLGVGAIIMKPMSRMANHAIIAWCRSPRRRRMRADPRNNLGSLAFLTQ